MWIKPLNRIILGLLMLVPGLLKLFVMGPTAVSSMLAGFGFPAAMFFAWVLIILEIVSGLMILASWNVRYAVWPPIVILLVAAIVTTFSSFTAGNVPGLLLHLAVVTNYLVLWHWSMHKEMGMKR